MKISKGDNQQQMDYDVIPGNIREEYEKRNMSSPFQYFLRYYEKPLILVLCIIALVRIFTYSAAFPFFNNVDEQAHFDTIVKYARGYLPTSGTNYYDSESAGIIAQYSTPEYFSRKPILFRVPPPVDLKNRTLSQKNYEAFSPPVYYVIAGAWYNFGKTVGFQGVNLLYWIRFLNLPIYALFLWVVYLYCVISEPDNLSLRMGVMLLISFFPQDVFYSINSDVLSPLFFICGLYLLTKIYKGHQSFWLWPLAGGMIACTVLVKLSNLPTILMFSIMLFLILIKTSSLGKLSCTPRTPHILAMFISLLTPIFIWVCFNIYNLGDLTGTSEKIMHFGWTLKPLSEWGDHPIFTIKGFVYFLSELALTFWRGEFFWRFERLASKSADILYFITTLIFGISGLIGIMLESREVSTDKKIFNYLHLFILVSFIMFLALLSIRYDFGNCLYPSKNLPYFTSGRLILASLVSFLIVYVKGIEYITSKFFKRIDPVVIILVIVLYSAFSEITISFDRGVFTSPYNYFNF